MADSNKPTSDFTLPPPGAPASQADTGQGTNVELPKPPDEPTSRDFLVGGGVLLVLMLAYFFAKNAYANMLVGNRIEPRSANAAGWWLFIFLTLVSAAAVLAAVNRAVLENLFIIVPLALGALVALILMLLSGRR